MALALTLVRGAVSGLGKRPSPAAGLPPTRRTEHAVRVDPRRVARYARLTGFTPGASPGDSPGGAAGAGPGAERDAAELPLTYPHVLGFPAAARIMAARAFPLPLLGLVHTSVEVVAHRPLTVADRPDLTVYAAGLRPHRRGTEVVMVTEARLRGALVWEDRSTYLARHRVEPRHDQGAGGSAAAPAAERPPLAPLPEIERWTLPADLGRRNARVTGDWNPIHLHPWTARPLGFPRAIVHGMWTAARCAAAAPGSRRLRVEFRRPVTLPATVVYAAAGDAFEVRSATGLHLTGTR
ncbi:MaoC/PaaZ C-terminal domain-containing protein [Streptomyces sp. V4-01]|uniref:MaoC/PaaZ C-terminal domain-containing protein n=1 Tax=Actinacidiphila polyblastidii TaxID=3110430 RepID=A0ABU7P810_9ACTN|nr:MaoC/PaaZ C-terminal domain-containing protein [Streptomyces sp. V4-01]